MQYPDSDSRYPEDDRAWTPPSHHAARSRRRFNFLSLHPGTVAQLVAMSMLALALIACVAIFRFPVPLEAPAVQQMPDTNQGQPVFPISTGYASGAKPTVAAVFVSTSTSDPPTPEITVTPLPVAGCASPGPAPVLDGGTVRDGTAPAPMVAGCPATIYISAPEQPHALVIISLTFGTANSISCSVYNDSIHTDAKGSAKVTIAVPGKDCFRSTIITSGSITVGSDNSANANLPAVG